MEKINLHSDGFKKIDDNIFKVSQNILNEFNEIHLNKNLNKNDYINTAIINNLEDLNSFMNTKNLYNQIFNTLLFNNFNNLVFDDIWFLKSDESIYEPDSLPYVPHIDKIRKIKVIIYLNDVGIKDGPIFICKIQPSKYEFFRRKLKPDYKLHQENIIKDLKLENYLPQIGEFGTVIFFDTNTPHFAGRLHNKESIRKIIRFNFRYKENNFLKKLINKIIG